MSRTKGTFSLTSNIEPKVGAPLDARTIVKLKTDLMASGTFDYPYKGLTVFVEEENKKYTLIGLDPTVLANWMEESASGAAADITYDNTTSQLQSTNVQDAIDELNAKPAGVQSDWNEDDTSDLSYIKNKPENLVQDANYVHTDNNYDDASKGKVDALGTASTKNVPTTGDASNSEVVLGNDSRLTDARPASDVSSWAKASTKPTYTASEVGAIATTLKGVANGVAELDDAGKVPSSQLPSFVDDVIEVSDYDHLPITGESGKIYVTLDTNKTYRWTGSGYAEISESLALGETSSTAYRGDRGKTAYDHSQDSGRITSAVSSGLYKFSATAQGHISGTTAVQKSDITALGIPAQDTTYSVATTSANGLMSSTDKVKLNKINEAHYLTNASSTDKIKININSTGQWMLSFVVSIYQSYRATRIQISGYNIGTDTYWYQPEAVLISDSDNSKLNVYFGYDSRANLWVGFDGGNYTGVSIDCVTNGHKEVTDYTGLFTISRVATLETIQTTLIPYSNHYTAAPTASQVLIASSANGGIKTSGYTIAKSVPSDAVFTDTNNAVTQTNLASTDTNSRRLLLSNSANDTSETKGVYKNTQLQFTPSTGKLATPKLDSKILTVTQTGTGTAAQDKGSGVSPRYFPAKWTFNLGYSPSDGDIINITLPVAGHSWGDWISIDNGVSYHPANTGGTGRLTTHYGVGTTIQLVFDADGQTNSMTPVNGADSVNGSNITGGCWRVVNYYDTNSNNYDRNNYTGTIKCGSTAIVAGNIIVGKDGVFHHLKDGTAFDINYPILYANGAIAANATSTNNYDVLAINLQTTQTITLTAYLPVFIKGTISGNIFTPVSTTPLTQTVPTTSDGYRYMLLGVAYSTTNIYLDVDHRIFAYKKDKFGEVVQDAETTNGFTVNKDVPSNAVFTDTNTKVTQTNSTGNANYRLLLSANANDTNETNISYKSTNFQANPSTGLLTVKAEKSTVNKSMLTGTGTAAQDKGSGVSPRYFPAKWTFNTGITVADGDMFTIKLPVAGHGYGEFISVDNGTNYYPVGYNTNTLLTTHFPVGAIITVVFKSDGVINSIYPVAGGDAKVNVSGGAFYVLDLYDSGNSNTYDRNRYNAAIKVWGTALVSQNIIVANTSGLYIHLKQNAAFDITYPILYLAENVAASATTTNTYDIINFATATTQSGTWTAYKPVFIKGQLSGTTFTPVSATPLTQTIPTTADGYEYILLGIATATTTVYLQERHPVYAYQNGRFGEYNYIFDALGIAENTSF